MSDTITIHQDHHICGLVPDAITQNDAYRFALHVGTLISDSTTPQILVAHDSSPLSRTISETVIGGLTGANCHVTNLGTAPYSMLTYGSRSLNIPNVLMITPGDSGPDHTGFKLTLNTKPVPSFMLKSMLEESRSEEFSKADGNGRCTDVNIFRSYFRWLLHSTRPRCGDISVLWDVQHGAAAEIVSSIAASLAGRHVVINQGMQPRQRQPTSETFGDQIVAGGFTLGVSINCDGTRIEIFDEFGRQLHEHQCLNLLSTRSKRQPIAGNGLLASRRKARSDLLKNTLKIIRILTESDKSVDELLGDFDLSSVHLGKGSVPTASQMIANSKM